MYVKFKFPFNSIVKETTNENGGKETVLVISKEQYEQLRELLSELPEDPLAEECNMRYSWKEYTGHLESVLQIVSCIEILEVIRVKTKGFEEFEECLHRINKSLSDMETRINRYHEQLFNKAVNVHIPGNALLDIEEVCYEVDCCTDRLTTLLNKGWRIIAVCPQPDQRRPDYILGLKSDV